MATYNPDLDLNNNIDKCPRLVYNLASFFPTSQTNKKSVCPYTHTRLLTLLLEDFVDRKGFTLSELVKYVVAYGDYLCEKTETDTAEHKQSVRSQYIGIEHFVYALLTLYSRSKSSTNSKSNCVVHDLKLLLRLLWNFTGSFQHVYSSTIDSRVITALKHSNISSDPFDLEFLLRHTPVLRVEENHTVRFVDAPLACGETPLMLACRHRRSDAVLLLLRYGARTNTQWLFFNNAFEVLLFSPNQVHVGSTDILEIERCAHFYQRASVRTDIRRLEEVEKEGRCALHQNWRTLIRPDQSKTPGSLQHLTKCAIRNSLKYEHEDLPTQITKLGVPTFLQKYLDLQFD